MNNFIKRILKIIDIYFGCIGIYFLFCYLVGPNIVSICYNILGKFNIFPNIMAQNELSIEVKLYGYVIGLFFFILLLQAF